MIVKVTLPAGNLDFDADDSNLCVVPLATVRSKDGAVSLSVAATRVLRARMGGGLVAYFEASIGQGGSLELGEAAQGATW